MPRNWSGRLVPTILGACGVALWATETALITYTTAIPPLQTVALAFAFATLLVPASWLCSGASPMVAFRQPAWIWILSVVSLVGYHACIYYATQKAPAAAAALLQGTTPLVIVLGSALLPGERLRWWHVAGAALGLCGVIGLVEGGGETGETQSHAAFYLSLIGIAAALWGLYAVLSRAAPEVPTASLGVFYAAAGLVTLVGHVTLEDWVAPGAAEWAAIAALGLLPMGLAIYLWDIGIKHGDIQALGGFAYVEPLIGAVLVALLARGALGWGLMWSGSLVLLGAALASASLWTARPLPEPELPECQRG